MAIVEKLAQSLETAPVARLCTKIGSFVAFIIVAFTGYQIAVDLDDRKFQRIVFEEERIERREAEKLRAWSYLLDPSLPARLRGAAFSTLVKSGEALGGVEMGCKFESELDRKSTDCPSLTRIDGIQMSGSDVGYLALDQVVLNDATLEEASLAISGDVNYFDRSELTNSSLIFSGSGHGFINSKLTGSAVYLDYTQILTIAMSDVSGTCFAILPGLSDDFMPADYRRNVSVASYRETVEGLENVDVVLESVWAYADNPPGCDTNTQQPIPVIDHVTLCDPKSPVVAETRLFDAYNFTSRSYYDSNASRQEGRLTLQLAAVLYNVEKETSESEAFLGAFRGCRPMTITEAAEQYPDRYGFLISEE